MNQKWKVLFICTHNSARSQMAESLLRALFGETHEAYSAGTEPSGINPLAIRAMREIGIDISTHRPKSVNEFQGWQFDYVVTVCNHARETCPVFPGGKTYLHHGFHDPSEAQGRDEEKIQIFRRVRDEIKGWIIKTFG